MVETGFRGNSQRIDNTDSLQQQYNGVQMTCCLSLYEGISVSRYQLIHRYSSWQHCSSSAAQDDWTCTCTLVAAVDACL